jgi:hypothetical protein
LFRRAALAGAGVWLAASAGPVRAASPNEKLNLAVVGCGGRGGENIKDLGAEENFVAVCDVDEGTLREAARRFPKARPFADYRKMLDAMHRGIDAVVVSTPDHMHAPVSLAAMQLGKHVYCEKPLTWCIDEARQMARVARQMKVATQMGTQGMALDGARAGIEAIRSGVLGEVREMHVWTDRAAGWWPQGVDRPRDTPPVPKGLHWDLWLGVAPARPYHPDYCPFKWRGWKDFGTGPLGDMGIHNGAMAYVALELGLPTAVEILETSGLKGETWPAWSKLRYEFPAKGARGPLTLFWYDGIQRPPGALVGRREVAKNGAILVGSKGTLYSIEWTGADWHLLPKDKFRDFKPPQPSLPRAPEGSQHREWVQACKDGPAPFCNFPAFASPMTETMLLGCLALRMGQKIEWDAAAMRATNCPAAEQHLRREARKGW